MYGGRLSTAIGLVRLARPGGFCPACRLLMKARDAGQEASRLDARFSNHGTDDPLVEPLIHESSVEEGNNHKWR